MADLKPGKYLRAKNGVVHGYSEVMARQPGVSVFVVDAKGSQDLGSEIEPDLHEKLIALMRDMPMDNMDLLTAGGMPRTDWLSHEVGEIVNAAQRDAAWDEIRPVEVGLSNADTDAA